jgi:hypothetical protein
MRSLATPGIQSHLSGPVPLRRQFELARVRRVKVALIERVAAFGRFDVPRASRPPRTRWRRSCSGTGGNAGEETPKCAVDPLSAMPSQEPQRTAEAMRRMLPELIRLHRYESRAVTRRDRAIRAIALRGKTA